MEGDEHARNFDTCAAQLFSELGEQRNSICTRDVQVACDVHVMHKSRDFCIVLCMEGNERAGEIVRMRTALRSQHGSPHSSISEVIQKRSKHQAGSLLHLMGIMHGFA